ncbi:MAG: ABC transporter permease subunit [Rhodobacterales bacterium]|nr:ABC transporter permease subunit [Rhodobacterales bacterium]
MVRRVVRIVVSAALTVAGAVGLVLLMMALAPGDPIDLIPGGEAIRPQLEAEWGLDQPLVVRWLQTLGRMARGDLGTSISYRPGAPVLEVIGAASVRSLGWLLAALLLAATQSVALAWYTAGRSSWIRGLLRWVSVAPVFLLAHLSVHSINTITFWGMNLSYWGRPEWFALPDQPSSVRAVLAVVLLAVGSGAVTELHLEVESALTRIRASGYVDAARARGSSTFRLVAWNLLPPLASLLANRAAFFAGGLVVLERVLLLNGAGSILWQSALSHDYPVAMGVALLAAIWVAGARSLADFTRTAVDPRMRESASW